MPQADPGLDTSRLPRQIRRQFQHATELQEQASRPPEGAAPPAGDPPPTPPSEGAAEPPAPAPPVEGSPPAEPERHAAPVPPAPAGDPRQATAAYWEQRFRIEQGITRQVRMERDRAETALHQRIADLETQLAAAQANAPAAARGPMPQAPSAPGAVDLSALFTPEQREQYGDDQLSLVASAAMKLAREQAQEAVRPLIDEQQRGREREQRDARSVFNAELEALIPDAFTIDATDDWRAWLDEPHPTYGTRRQDMLNAAVRAGNAQGAAALFRDYKRERGHQAAGAPAAPTPQPRPPMAPRGSGGPPAAPVPASRADLLPPTDAEVTDFYKRRATKKHGDVGYISDEEARKFEARLALRMRPQAAA